MCTSLKSQSDNTKMFQLYPNPNNGEFVITSQSNLDLKIVNELGQMVGSITLDENNGYKATVNNLVEGVYFVIGVNNTNLINQKIIVTK
jgi:hypothetical protein